MFTVKKYVRSNSGSDDDVSDVFQETIIALYNQITNDELKLTTDLKGYFFSVARNIWSAQLRKTQRLTELEDDVAEVESHISEEEANPTLERIISRVFPMLPVDQQTVLNLFSEGYTYEEIAVKMNLKSEVYARRKKYLSKEALLELMKKDEEYQDTFLFDSR